ncbi:hypothetical protein KI387_026053, partial [Taxus chinensis]
MNLSSGHGREAREKLLFSRVHKTSAEETHSLSGADGLVGMKLICGTTTARKKARQRKGYKYDKEEKAAISYDLGIGIINRLFSSSQPLSAYEKELEEMKPMTRQEYVANLR